MVLIALLWRANIAMRSRAMLEKQWQRWKSRATLEKQGNAGKAVLGQC